ncbi:hypothetical protein OX284_015650 [Flavobacterium sp. SUN046]|uniref:hypothetical protein n=1 Tax=Flavobacterium sp. SUN046 TaxID=3002440 RepID=UPI002DBA2DE6|nr:hypothetical protein [Flavobacterium sp. SUN046]MEC4050871.1 hypothetical protein [Flavobacterium sp. SUN046]
MTTTNEKGNAKNISNALLITEYIIELGTTYNPTNSKLSLSNLQSTQQLAAFQQQQVNALLAPYTLAVDNREALFSGLNKKVTKLQNVLKTTEGITNLQIDDFMTVARRIKGKRLTKIDPNDGVTHHSNAQLSFDQRTNNFDILISFLINTPNYNPNEIEFQINSLQQFKNQMLQATELVNTTYIALNKARSLKNDTMYRSQNNLVDTFNKAKVYLLTIIDSQSVQHKAISNIVFRKI